MRTLHLALTLPAQPPADTAARVAAISSLLDAPQFVLPGSDFELAPFAQGLQHGAQLERILDAIEAYEQAPRFQREPNMLPSNWRSVLVEYLPPVPDVLSLHAAGRLVATFPPAVLLLERARQTPGWSDAGLAALEQVVGTGLRDARGARIGQAADVIAQALRRQTLPPGFADRAGAEAHLLTLVKRAVGWLVALPSAPGPGHDTRPEVWARRAVVEDVLWCFAPPSGIEAAHRRRAGATALSLGLMHPETWRRLFADLATGQPAAAETFFQHWVAARRGAPVDRGAAGSSLPPLSSPALRELLHLPELWAAASARAAAWTCIRAESARATPPGASARPGRPVRGQRQATRLVTRALQMLARSAPTEAERDEALTHLAARDPDAALGLLSSARAIRRFSGVAVGAVHEAVRDQPPVRPARPTRPTRGSGSAR